MKWLIGGLAIVFGPVMFVSFLSALFVQAWSPIWFGQQGGPIKALPIGDLPLLPPPNGPAPVITDAYRYQLALAAGFSQAEAETATAISIAENGGGDPAALSGVNFDGSRDLGLWQINSGWWPRFGGQTALSDPQANAHAAHTIYGLQGWCAWSTYDTACGRGHNSAYRNYLARARAAALA